MSVPSALDVAAFFAGGREPEPGQIWIGPCDRIEPELPEDPQAGPGWHPDPAPPMTDAFYRAIGDYCRAQNAKADPEPEAEP